MLFAHNKTSLLHICFCVVQDKDSTTTGHFKIDKLTSSVNNIISNTMLYHGTIICLHYGSMVIYIYTQAIKINNANLRYSFIYK